MLNLLSLNEQYWTRRAPSYTDVINENLLDGWERIWANELISRFPKRGDVPLKVLDIGTGPGFYAIILARRGYQLTAVDYSEGMLDEARKNAGNLAEKINFCRMDAHHLEADDNSYDVIVTRNLTWNLAEPVQAYHDWKRVLRPGGVLLNFDANWYSYLFDKQKQEEFQEDRINVVSAGMFDHSAYEESDLMEDITRKLPMGRLQRPQWDVETLRNLGFSFVNVDTAIGDRVWNDEEKINYASTPGFLIHAVK